MKLVLINDYGLRGIRILPSFVKLLTLIERRVRPENGILNVVLISDETMKPMNRKYRGKNKTTDVLTFNYVDGSRDDLRGEIYISIPTAERQTKEVSWTLAEELNKLFVHGVLHFFGYDHVKESDYRVMKLIEDDIIVSFGGKPYNCS